MSKNTTSQVWLVTGASRGLGWETTLAAQQAGHTVIGSSRNPSKDTDKITQFEAQGGSWAALDVSSPDLEKQLDVALEKHGRIDVLINNAGYATCGTLEDTSLEIQRSLMETNFWGPLRTMRHLIPSMRDRGSGTIVNITSMEAIRTIPTLAIYEASKTALQALTFAVRQEVAELGIRVLAAAPGAIRTGFNEAATGVPVSEPYNGTLSSQIQNVLMSSGGQQSGDPKKMALRIVEAVDVSGLVKSVVGSEGGFEQLDWMPLGSDIGSYAKANGSEMKAKAERLEGIWSSVDIEGI